MLKELASLPAASFDGLKGTVGVFQVRLGPRSLFYLPAGYVLIEKSLNETATVGLRAVGFLKNGSALASLESLVSRVSAGPGKERIERYIATAKSAAAASAAARANAAAVVDGGQAGRANAALVWE